VLNLLARAPAADAEVMLRRSFAAFQRAPEIAAARARLAALPADPLRERPCGDRLATRSKFDDLLHRLRRARRRTDDAADEIARLGQAVVAMPCTGCTVVDRCVASLKELAVTERERRALRRELGALEDREVAEFRARAGVLRDLGYLDQSLRLTDAGHTASRIRHPRMLVISEAIRGRVFPTKPAALASTAGALGTERLLVPRIRPLIRHGGSRASQAGAQAWATEPGLEDVSRAVVALRRIVARLNAVRREAGLPADALEEELTPTGSQPAQAMWRASAVGAWASGRAWGSITTRHHVPDGDLQRLIWQAAEILAQLEDLPGHLLVAPAREARAALLRAPVI
jgi:superfamily II RNA helicase